MAEPMCLASGEGAGDCLPCSKKPLSSVSITVTGDPALQLEVEQMHGARGTLDMHVDLPEVPQFPHLCSGTTRPGVIGGEGTEHVAAVFV